MVLPYQISTLLYCFIERHEALLLERPKEPDLDLWRASGDKLKKSRRWN